MTDLILTPVLAAALANKPRRRPHARKNKITESKNNFVAEAQKTKPGAPLGNRNAATRDPDVLIRRSHHADVRALVRHCHGLANLAVAAARFGETGRRLILTGLAEDRDA